MSRLFLTTFVLCLFLFPITFLLRRLLERFFPRHFPRLSFLAAASALILDPASGIRLRRC